LNLKQSLHTDYELLENTPEQLAIVFLSHFIDAPIEKLEELDITKALSQLIYSIAEETRDAIKGTTNTRTLH